MSLSLEYRTLRLPACPLAALALLLSACAHGGAAQSEGRSDQGAGWYAGYQRDSRLVSLPGGRSLNLYCLGSGSPTIVLESGIGQSAYAWWTVQGQIARLTRVCAYDRAGMGKSPPGPLPRDTSSEVADLEALLHAGGVRPPYVLVGHSMGGFNARLFADLHANEIAGMVLVDPSIENQIPVLETAAPDIARNDQRSVAFLHYCADPSLSDSDFGAHCVRAAPATFSPALAAAYGATQTRAHYVAFASEVDSFFHTDSQQVLSHRGSFGAMPLIVLTRGEPSQDIAPEQAAFELNFLRQKHAELASLSTRGRNIVVTGATHNIPDDKPDAVVAAVREVLRERRGARPA